MADYHLSEEEAKHASNFVNKLLLIACAVFAAGVLVNFGQSSMEWENQKSWALRSLALARTQSGFAGERDVLYREADLLHLYDRKRTALTNQEKADAAGWEHDLAAHAAGAPTPYPSARRPAPTASFRGGQYGPSAVDLNRANPPR